MQKTNTTRIHLMKPDGVKAVKEFFSIKDSNYEYDIRLIITAVKRMRIAQKKYFAGARTPQKQELLLQAKQAELSLEALCNQMWSKHVSKNR